MLIFLKRISKNKNEFHSSTCNLSISQGVHTAFTHVYTPRVTQYKNLSFILPFSFLSLHICTVVFISHRMFCTESK